MQGFIQRQIPIFVRRLVTMLPALVVAAIGLDPSRTLVISQVVLSFGIPFALIPLVWFTSRRDLMGTLVNQATTTAVAVAGRHADLGAERLPARPDVRDRQHDHGDDPQELERKAGAERAAPVATSNSASFGNPSSCRRDPA